MWWPAPTVTDTGDEAAPEAYRHTHWISGDLTSYHPDMGWVQAFAGAAVALDLSPHALAADATFAEAADSMTATANVIEAARAHEVPRLIFGSSIDVLNGFRDTETPGTPLPCCCGGSG